MATNKPRYTVSVDIELFEQIENFRFEHRFQTRSEATVELIRLGLEQLKKEEEEKSQKTTPAAANGTGESVTSADGELLESSGSRF